MIYGKIVLTAFVLLLLVYYILVIGHLFSLWSITEDEVTFKRLCTPFYYWISHAEKE